MFNDVCARDGDKKTLFLFFVRLSSLRILFLAMKKKSSRKKRHEIFNEIEISMVSSLCVAKCSLLKHSNHNEFDLINFKPVWPSFYNENLYVILFFSLFYFILVKILFMTLYRHTCVHIGWYKKKLFIVYTQDTPHTHYCVVTSTKYQMNILKKRTRAISRYKYFSALSLKYTQHTHIVISFLILLLAYFFWFSFPISVV